MVVELPGSAPGGSEVRPPMKDVCEELHSIIEMNNILQKRVSKLADKYRYARNQLGKVAMDAHVMSEKARIVLKKLMEAGVCE